MAERANAQALTEVWSGGKRFPIGQTTQLLDRAVAVVFAEYANPQCVYVAGPQTLTNGATVFGVVQYDLDGTVLHQTTWPASPAANKVYQPMGMAVAYSNQYSQYVVYVTGSQPGLSNKSDFATIALSQDLSTVEWNRSFDYTDPTWGRNTSGDDVATAIAAVDGSSVCVTGISEGTNFDKDIQTVIYAQDGTLRVATAYTRIASSGHYSDSPVGVFVAHTSSDDIVMVGGNLGTSSTTSVIGGWYYDLSSSGSFPTESRYFTDGYPTARAMTASYGATDPARNRMYITGTSKTGSTNDMLTLKFDWLDSPSNDTHAIFDSGNGADAGLAIKYQVAKFPGNLYRDVVVVGGYAAASSTTSSMNTIQYRDLGSSGLDLDWQATDSDAAASNQVNALDFYMGSASDGSDWWIAITGQVASSGYLNWRTQTYDGTHLNLPAIKSYHATQDYIGASGGDDVPAKCWFAMLYNSSPPPTYAPTIFVTGRSWSSTSGDDFLTHRYEDLN